MIRPPNQNTRPLLVASDLTRSAAGRAGIADIKNAMLKIAAASLSYRRSSEFVIAYECEYVPAAARFKFNSRR